VRGSHPPNCCRRLKPLKVGVHVAFRQLCWLPCNFKFLHVLCLTQQCLKAATFLHVYMLTEQSLMASAQQYFAGSSVIYILLLGARNMEYLHVFLFTKKNTFVTRTVLATMSTSVLSCLGTMTGSQQHQVPLLRAASEQSFLAPT